MATYYVNLSASSNGGGASRNDPYNALSALPTLSAGDVVEIEPGTAQTMSGSYTMSGSGSSAAAPITIRANPAVSGAKPILTLSAEGGVGIIVTGRSHIVIENIAFKGAPSWTSQNSIGVRLNGGLTNIRLTGVDCQYCRFDLVGGFATNGVTLTNCSANDNATDGIRMFSGTGTYTWQAVSVLGGTYSRNGTAAGANGAGISLFVQAGHTGTVFQDITIRGCTVDDNYRAGITCNDGSVAWATIIGAGNTTAPTRQIKGLRIENNIINDNGGAGISVMAAQPNGSFPVSIAGNLCDGNGSRTTLGNIWTGGSLSPIIERNRCFRARTNGTVVGDGQGIFDDQWNDGAIVRHNWIEANVFDASTNPEYASYGIGIYRSANGKHYGNVIKNCRHGFVIGYVASATAPTMEGIEVHNNTVAGFDGYAVSVWSDTPADALSVRNNLFSDGPQDIEAQSGTAGDQGWSGNAAIGVTTKYTGNNVGASAVDHALADAADIASSLRPLPGSPLLSGGVDLGYLRDLNRRQSKKHIGAFGASRLARN